MAKYIEAAWFPPQKADGSRGLAFQRSLAGNRISRRLSMIRTEVALFFLKKTPQLDQYTASWSAER